MACLLRHLVVAWIVLGGTQAPARAQTPARASQPGWRSSLTATPWFQGAAGVGGGGSFRARGVLLRGGVDGPVGEGRRAGLTISYDRTRYAFSASGALGQADPWTDVQHLGVGARLRFRLRRDGPFPDGIGEEHAIPVFVHAGARLGRSVALDVHAGALLHGALRVEDRGGHRIDERDFDPALLLGATASARF